MSTFEKIQLFISLAVLLVIIAQAAIYYQQRKLMERQAEGMKISERAYIGVKKIEVAITSQEMTVFVTFLNGGRTPAWNFKVPALLTLGTEFPEDEPTEQRQGAHFMPAGIEREVTYDFPVSFQELDTKLREGKVNLFLKVKCTFRDAWRDSRKQRFHLVYDVRKGEFVTYEEPVT